MIERFVTEAAKEGTLHKAWSGARLLSRKP